MDPLPPELGDVFSVHAARSAGVSDAQLRHRLLDKPFRGVRSTRPVPAPEIDDPFERQRRELRDPERKIAIEYHGVLHHAQYAKDVERIAALRAAGWIVIEVTSALFATPTELLRRIRAARRDAAPV